MRSPRNDQIVVENFAVFRADFLGSMIRRCAIAGIGLPR
jgi:hypothetical protein